MKNICFVLGCWHFKREWGFCNNKSIRNSRSNQEKKFLDYKIILPFLFKGTLMQIYHFHDGGRYHIETGPWTGFYMITASVLKELKISLYVCVNIKTIPWKFCILNTKNFRVICPWRTFKRTFQISHVRISQKGKRYFHVKSSTCYFHIRCGRFANLH